MRMRDVTQLSMYDGEVAVLGYGEKRTFKGVSNGPVSMVVDGVLYAYSDGGDFHFEIVAPRDATEVHFEGAKGVRMSLAKNPGATWIKGNPETSWTRDEPRPPVNPQLAALQQSIRALEHQLSLTQVQARAKAQQEAVKASVVPTHADGDTSAPASPENGSQDVSETTPE